MKNLLEGVESAARMKQCMEMKFCMWPEDDLSAGTGKTEIAKVTRGRRGKRVVNINRVEVN